MKEWGVLDNYTCQAFVILGYIDGEELTQLQCIERMIKDLELLRANDYDFWHEDAAKAAEDVAKIWSKVVLAMWW